MRALMPFIQRLRGQKSPLAEFGVEAQDAKGKGLGPM